jgi:hypothetical protein
MNKSFREYKDCIKSIDPPYDRENEFSSGTTLTKYIRLAMVNIIDDWGEERNKLYGCLKILVDSIEEMHNLPSVNQMQRLCDMIKEWNLEKDTNG